MTLLALSAFILLLLVPTVRISTLFPTPAETRNWTCVFCPAIIITNASASVIYVVSDSNLGLVTYSPAYGSAFVACFPLLTPQCWIQRF